MVKSLGGLQVGYVEQPHPVCIDMLKWNYERLWIGFSLFSRLIFFFLIQVAPSFTQFGNQV